MVITIFNCSQNLAFARFARKIRRVLARARKIFAIARVFGFSLNLLDFSNFRKSCKTCYVRNDHTKYC